ncbi:hypothetical protein [Demequina rhizosphaerae]|uniref:hypothetical protein n=1 Tax=Demequina rhizosphaerae TaxID=1638985 RepID=UPI0007821EA3|nr:hypothetical protein [Demequina rhizosphaerae]
MPTYILEGDRAVPVPRGPVLIAIAERSGAALTTGVRLVARAGDRPAAVFDAGHDQIVVTDIPAPVTISIAAPDGMAVSADSDYVITATVEDGSGDPQVVVVPSVRAAGLESMGVLVLTPIGDTVSVARVPGGVASLALTGLARDAQVAARRMVRADQLPDGHAVSPSLVVDGSASMLPWISSGAVGRAVDAVVGVCDVIAPGITLTCQIEGHSPQAVSAADPSTLGARVTAALEGVPLARGFSFESASPEGAARNAVRYVVTDAVPTSLPRDAEGQGPSRIHLVVLGDPLAAQLQPDPHLSMTVIPEFGAEGDWRPDDLVAVVGSLIAPHLATTN